MSDFGELCVQTNCINLSKKPKIEETNSSIYMSEVSTEQDFDNEYSRLIGSIGKDALKSLQHAKVLLIGLQGLGIEVAKNLVLMGVASLSIYDLGAIQHHDLASQFFLSENDVGSNYADRSLQKLTELNERVSIDIITDTLTEALVKRFTFVAITHCSSKTEIMRLNTICHANNIGFLAADIPGLFGFIFVDLGPRFVTFDVDGEPVKTCIIESITCDKKSIVHVIESKRHDLVDGDYITFEGVEGMTELNGKEFVVAVLCPYSFSIGDTSSFSDYIKGGCFKQIKRPQAISFRPLAEFWSKPIDLDKVLNDFSKIERIPQYHLFVQALLAFRESGKAVTPWNLVEANSLVDKVKEIAPDAHVDKVDVKLIMSLAKISSGYLSPMAAFFGGIVAQEIIKAVSHKFTPLNQWFFFDSLECLSDQVIDPADAILPNSRYSGQIAVFGRAFHEKLMNARYFLVGSGAIGCEMLKNWAMIGLGCGPQGHITLADTDLIEISNLNRQFLYRSWDIGKLKCDVAAKAALNMNPNIHIDAVATRVGAETEAVYNDEFWSSLTGVCNALDNVPTRLYVDARCLFYKRSLLESGTMGIKANVQVIVPDLTESYGSSVDPPIKETPVCLLHSFPHNIEHCLQWAREQAFETYFVQQPEIANNYLDKPGYLDSLSPTLLGQTLHGLHKNILNRQNTFEECIVWARNEFEYHYNHQPKQLLYLFPLDHVDSNGVPFWRAAKKPPMPLIYNPENEVHLDFVVSATFLRAYTLDIIASEFKPDDYQAQRLYIKRVSSEVAPMPFKVRTGIKIATDESDKNAVEYNFDDTQLTNQIMADLDQMTDRNWRCRVVELEKDNDQNFHIDFIAAASNLRAIEYGITPLDRLQSKLIAGKIVPAIVTTTAAITGLVCLELYKLFQPCKKIESYRNSFLNLGLPVIQQSEPLPPVTRTFLGKKFTLWDKIEVRIGDVTLGDVLKWFETELKLTVDFLSVGASLIYFSYNPAKAKERMGKNLKDLVTQISKQPLSPVQTWFVVQVTGYDLDGNTVEDLPDIAYYFK